MCFLKGQLATVEYMHSELKKFLKMQSSIFLKRCVMEQS